MDDVKRALSGPHNSVLPELTPLDGLTIKDIMDVVSPEDRKALHKKLYDMAMKRRTVEVPNHSLQACDAPCCLPVLEVRQCFWCNGKRVRSSEYERLKNVKHRVHYVEELCNREGCDPLKGTYPKPKEITV